MTIPANLSAALLSLNSIVVMNLTITANTLNYDVRAQAIAAGWDGLAPLKLTVTVNSGVYVGSSSTGTPAMTVGSTYPTGSTLSLVNNGNILGMGGTGGAGGYQAVGSAGAAGGPALSAGYATTVTNNGVIGGGGGGGGGGFDFGTGDDMSDLGATEEEIGGETPEEGLPNNDEASQEPTEPTTNEEPELPTENKWITKPLIVDSVLNKINKLII